MPEKRFPFVTVVTADRYDAASHLDRDAVTYRVNLAMDRHTYQRLFGPAPRQAAGYEVINTGGDYTRRRHRDAAPVLRPDALGVRSERG